MIAKLADVISEGATPRMAGTPHRSGGGITPGRASVRDKLNINPEEALMEEYENGYGAKQQQVTTKQLSTFTLSKALLTKWVRVGYSWPVFWLYQARLHSIFPNLVVDLSFKLVFFGFHRPSGFLVSFLSSNIIFHSFV